MNPQYTGPIKTHADARCLARKLQAIHEASGRKHSEHLDAAAMLLWSWQYVAERPSVGERIARLANAAGPDAKPCAKCGAPHASYLPSAHVPGAGSWMCDSCYNARLAVFGDGQGIDARNDRLALEAEARRVQMEGRR